MHIFLVLLKILNDNFYSSVVCCINWVIKIIVTGYFYLDDEMANLRFLILIFWGFMMLWIRKFTKFQTLRLSELQSRPGIAENLWICSCYEEIFGVFDKWRPMFREEGGRMLCDTFIQKNNFWYEEGGGLKICFLAWRYLRTTPLKKYELKKTRLNKFGKIIKNLKKN